MNYKKAIEILELDVDEINLDNLKKNYKRLALKKHPDKNGNTEESKIMFQELSEAFDFLKREIKVEEEIESKSSLYFDILKSFMQNVFQDKYSDFLSKIVNDVILSGKKISIKLFDNLDKETVLNIYNFLSTNRCTLHLSEDILKIIQEIVVKKYDNVEIYKLNPSITDLLNNNLYKLHLNDKLFLVPLWHNECYFDVSGCEVIVICEPELPINLTIDDDNNIYIKTSICLQDIFKKEFLLIKLEEREYNIPFSNLFIKREQNYRIKNVGISKIKENIYDVSEKKDIIVNIKIM